jgi:hypothetical protein
MLFATVATPVLHMGMHRAEALERDATGGAPTGPGAALSSLRHRHDDADCPICSFLSGFHVSSIAPQPVIQALGVLPGRPAPSLLTIMIRQFHGVPLGLRAPPA